MIEPHTPEESSAQPETHESFLQIDVPEKNQKLRPHGNYIWLKYEKPATIGGIIMPGKAKGLDWITAEVIAVGPDCKSTKAGDRVILATKGLVGGEDGIFVAGQRWHLTQENMCVGAVE